MIDAVLAAAAVVVVAVDRMGAVTGIRENKMEAVHVVEAVSTAGTVDTVAVACAGREPLEQPLGWVGEALRPARMHVVVQEVTDVVIQTALHFQGETPPVRQG